VLLNPSYAARQCCKFVDLHTSFGRTGRLRPGLVRSIFAHHHVHPPPGTLQRMRVVDISLGHKKSPTAAVVMSTAAVIFCDGCCLPRWLLNPTNSSWLALRPLLIHLPSVSTTLQPTPVYNSAYCRRLMRLAVTGRSLTQT
jgi:hypothetical protein